MDPRASDPNRLASHTLLHRTRAACTTAGQTGGCRGRIWHSAREQGCTDSHVSSCSCVGEEGCQIGGRMHQEGMVALLSVRARKALAARADDAHSWSGGESVHVHAGAGAYDHVDATGRK